MESRYIIATLGSHSALQILKGAKDEGFATLLIVTTDREVFYRRFPFIDTILTIPSFADLPRLEKKLKRKQIIIVPHGSFVAYLGAEKNKNIALPYFGNKKVLDWESNRRKQHRWLTAAGINVPRQFESVEDIDYPVIVKSYGADGGKGYFYAKNRADFQRKISKFRAKPFIIQEYIIGVTVFLHYFYSPIEKKVELLSIDRRYESNVDSLGRIPLVGQEGLTIEPSYVVIGNSPLVVRESLLPEIFAMGEKIVAASRKLIDTRGLFGPFCLETVVTPDQKFYAIEISCRIVAGTNLFIAGSPYSWLTYPEPMSTGRRIAREIKEGIKKRRLNLLLD